MEIIVVMNKKRRFLMVFVDVSVDKDGNFTNSIRVWRIQVLLSSFENIIDFAPKQWKENDVVISQEAAGYIS